MGSRQMVSGPMRKFLAALAVSLLGVGPLCAQTGPAAPALAPGAAPPAAGTSLAAPLPAAELFYRPPDIEHARLSPSGRWLAMTTGLGGTRVGLVVFDLQAWKPHAQAARFEDADIGNFSWVNDEHLVFSVQDRSRGGTDQPRAPGLFVAARDGSGWRQLVHAGGTRAEREDRPHARELLSAQHRLLHVPTGGGDEVIVGEWTWRNDGEFREVLAKRLNVMTGRTVSLSRGAPDHASTWLFDAAGEPRVVVARHDKRVQIHWRGPGDTGWRQLADSDALAMPFVPRFVDSAGALWVTSKDPVTQAAVLRQFDFATGKPATEPLVSTPGFDFSGGLVAENQGGPALGVHVVTDGETTVWFNPQMAALQVQADARLPGRVNQITCRRCGQPDMVAAVLSTSDRDPGQVWIYTAGTQIWRKVGDVRKGVDPRRMATTDFARIKARDGLEFPVWLTLPPGPKQARAAVVLVHGGPWVRGRHWQWDADAQFLASRGYAVIEPEFRGSRGYGQALYRAGWRQWGQAMQDDVADALAWAVKQGHVDAKRVCIAGASYGGYATLMGLVRHPDLYRCGVAWAAVTDPRLMYKWRDGTDQSDEVRSYYYPELIGDPVTDAAMIESVTPVLLAGRVQAPLMLAFGGQDRRVPLVHGTLLREALRAAGKEPVWVVYPDEGHGWFKLENQLDFARRMDAFLAEHLK